MIVPDPHHSNRQLLVSATILAIAIGVASLADREGVVGIAFFVACVAYIATALAIGDWFNARRVARGRKAIPFMFLHVFVATFLLWFVSVMLVKGGWEPQVLIGVPLMILIFYVAFFIAGALVLVSSVAPEIVGMLIQRAFNWLVRRFRNE